MKAAKGMSLGCTCTSKITTIFIYASSYVHLENHIMQSLSSLCHHYRFVWVSQSRFCVWACRNRSGSVLLVFRGVYQQQTVVVWVCFPSSVRLRHFLVSLCLLSFAWTSEASYVFIQQSGLEFYVLWSPLLLVKNCRPWE